MTSLDVTASPTSIRVSQAKGIAEIVMQRPPVNAYTYTFLRELASAIDELRIDPDVKAVVLSSGIDGIFSAGADLKTASQANRRQLEMTSLLGQEVFQKIESTPLVFVAAVGGHALGGGLELALACDFRFVTEGSYFIGLPEASIGFVPGHGGTQRLPRIVGLGKALDLMLMARRLTPQEALDVGIADSIWADAQACRNAALAYARQLSSEHAEVIGRIKVVTRAGVGAPVQLGHVMEQQAGTVAFGDWLEEEHGSDVTERKSRSE